MSLPKSKLNEYCQKYNLPTPIYEIYPFKGQPHDPIYHGGHVIICLKNNGGNVNPRVLKVVNQNFSSKRDIENFLAHKALTHLELNDFDYDIELDGMSGYTFKGGMGQLETNRAKSIPVPIPVSPKILNPMSPIRIPTPNSKPELIPISIFSQPQIPSQVSQYEIPPRPIALDSASKVSQYEIAPKSKPNNLFDCWDSPSNIQLCVFDDEKIVKPSQPFIAPRSVALDNTTNLKMNIYLIDYDNMAHAGKILDTLNGKIHLFVSFTFNTDKIPGCLESKVKIHKAHSPNKEMVDHMMTWYACKNIKLLKWAKVYVVSKDTGMYSLVEILKHKKIDAEFVSDINALV